MARVTALKMDGSKRRFNVFVDGSFSFTVDKDVAMQSGLQIGQDLSGDQIENLEQASLLRGCFDAALRYLSHRPRSEAEVRWRLFRHGFGNDVVNGTISKLKERGLIDDVAFAQFWKDNRMLFSPRSRQLIKLELRQKGIDAEIANEMTDDLDEEASAYKAGLKKARLLTFSDYNEYRCYLSGYLRRRGFDYEVISSVIAKLWQERQIAIS